MQVVLILLMSLSAVGSLYYFFNNLSSDALAQSEKILFFPENPPQIIATRCYSDMGIVVLSSVEGDILYTLKELNGDTLSRGVISVNISDLGDAIFGGPMDKGKQYTLRLYSPKWSVTDSCTSNYNPDLVSYYAFDEAKGNISTDKKSNSILKIYGLSQGSLNGGIWESGHMNSGIRLDGINDYIELSSDKFNLTGNLTIGGWVYLRGESSNRFPQTDNGFESGALANGFISYEQRNSSLTIVSEPHTGLYSAQFLRQGFEAYPGVCYGEANQSYKVSWNGTHCIGTNNYLYGQTIASPDSNTVMWGGLKFGTGTGSSSAEQKLNLSEEHFYILNYWYKKNITTTSTGVYLCASMGWCSLGLGYPAQYLDSIPSGVYNNWTEYISGFSINSNMSQACDFTTCLREFILAQHNYATIPEDERILLDDFKLVESNLINKPGSYTLAVSNQTVYGEINDNKILGSLNLGWNMVTLIYDGSYIYLYINDTLVNTAVYSLPLELHGESLRFGGFVNGSVDDFFIYNRSLNQTEVSEIYGGTYPTESLIGRWNLDEGTGSDIIDARVWSKGKKASAISFDSDDFGKVKKPSELELSTFALSYWFSPGNWVGSNWQGMHIRKYGTGSSVPYWTYGARPGEALTFEMRNDTGTFQYLTTSKTDWTLDTWYHIVAQYEKSTGNWSIYVNGDIDNTKIDPINISTTEGDFGIGLGLFNGLIDEVKIYNRSLTPDEIKWIYTGYTG